ncbi:MAG: trehalose-6-phosphate synthase [Alphaproteobacteria bacterium]|nr:trehalose-6-phosphate synthase [Alphaproteobacteria bacterium]
MSRLVIVSNRVADVSKSVQSGGLAVALADALRERGGIWFGWDGRVVADDAPINVTINQYEEVQTATLPLNQRDYDEYYVGFSNNVLWPSFHYRLDLGVIDSKSIEGYRRVNQRFARSLAALLEPDDLIWVHDYHFIPLAAELRALGVKQRIGFFLHIPFPPPDIFLAVPEQLWLARALFSYDLVGFQTASDTSNFIRYVLERAEGEQLSESELSAFGCTTRFESFPIGIDVGAFHAMANTPKAEEQIQRIHRRSMASSQIIGVDRLDYSKGLPDRLRAFRRLLELYPENRKAVTLMQISPPTREDVAAYSDIRQELEGLSGAINGEYSDFDWTPVRYIHRAIPRDTLAALFRGSQVGLVTPLRDGMNLVAKEYVAAQDEDNPGALVLSRFAGAAEDLVEAILVNPYDTDEVALALQRALTMRIEERRERHQALIRRVREHDVTNWRESFLDRLRKSRHPVDDETVT